MKYPRSRSASQFMVCTAIAFFIVSIFAGCSSRKNDIPSPIEQRRPFASSKAPKSELRELRRLVIAPVFVMPNASDAQTQLASIESQLEQQARGRLRIETVMGEEVQKKAAGLYGSRRPNFEDWVQLMDAFSGDGLLETVILRFKERRGSRIGADSPAEVGVRYTLYRSEREPVWEASFHFRDQALSEDFLSAQNRFSSQGGRGWKGASALLEASMDQALSELESQREKSFVVPTNE